MFCNGDSGVVIHGEPREGVISMISAKVVIEEVKILVPADGSAPMDDTYKQLLPERCRWASSCNKGYVSYAEPKENHKKRPSCHWHLVQKLPMERITLPTAQKIGKKEAYLNREANLVLPLADPEVPITGCDALFTKAAITVWSDLIVVQQLTHSTDRDLNRLESRELRLDLSSKIRAEFQALVTQEHYVLN